MSVAEFNRVRWCRRSDRVVTAAVPGSQEPGAVSGAIITDDLSRNVNCILGLPIDAIDMGTVLGRIEAAADRKTPVLISTPNLNFLVNSRSDAEFRESVLDSDLCPADGMPILWIARLLGVPMKERVSGSDIFEALKTSGGQRLRVFLFGGAQGVAAAAAKTLNAHSAGLSCVGWIDPGFGTVEEMSREDILAAINASDADFLAVSLGANKGQLWLHRNHKRLTIPVRAHLGTTINFQAGTVRRAPVRLQAWGLEWLWRIKEEPHLWRRYWKDGCVLLRLLLTRVLPLAIATRWQRRHQRQDFGLKFARDKEDLRVNLCGTALERHVGKAVSCLREVLTGRENSITVDLSETRAIDARFIGLLLMLRKQLKARGAKLRCIGAPLPIARIFRLNEVGFLLAPDQST
jgi:N-acetylglucosaminyldiphosphoundecaprenol N-acetyl-beta-D-mannosaminyltransferase